MYKRIWDSCVYENNMKLDIDRIEIEQNIDFEDNICDQNFDTLSNYNFTLTVNGKDIVTTINIPFQRLILREGE
jgi:hypothetical protein